MRKALVAAAVAVAPLGVASGHPSRHHRLHMRGCNTRSCDRRIGRWYYRRHHRPPHAMFRSGGMSSAVASWYDDSGATGCGFHTTYGIAVISLVPCGGRVTLCHAGRCVVATRDDSGPYVGGRLFDLNATTKAAIACSDLCTVDYRVGG